jgi:hypothetical protein
MTTAPTRQRRRAKKVYVQVLFTAEEAAVLDQVAAQLNPASPMRGPALRHLMTLGLGEYRRPGSIVGSPVGLPPSVDPSTISVIPQGAKGEKS